MSDQSRIEWTDATWNPVVGCTPVSPGCLNCYAARMAVRLEGMKRLGYTPVRRDADGRDVTNLAGLQCETDRTVRIAEVKGGRPVFTGDVRLVPERLTNPLAWRKPRMVFVDSMSDLFHESVPFEFIDRVFAVMALCPQHTFQILTKRPERMAEYFACGGARRNIHVYDAAAEMIADDWSRMPGDMAHTRSSGGAWWPLPNVWLGTSVESQAQAPRVWEILKCPAVVRFVSVEPMVGPVDLDAIEALYSRWRKGPTMGVYLDWVIVGGESGKDARPCNVEWVRSIVKQCAVSDVPCFVKQLGSVVEMTFDEWNTLTGGGTSGSDRFTLLFEGCDRGYWRPLHSKGGNPIEWPEDLRVQQFPAERNS